MLFEHGRFLSSDGFDADVFTDPQRRISALMIMKQTFSRDGHAGSGADVLSRRIVSHDRY
jgi:hypothetical protein